MAISRATDERDARAIIGLLAEGHSLGQAARLLGLSRRTADRRLAAARSALGAERTTEAVARAQRMGWLGARPVAAPDGPATTPQAAPQADVPPAAPVARVRALLRAGRLADAASLSAAWLSHQPAGAPVVTQVLLGLRCRSLALLGRTDDAERELASLRQSAAGAGTDLHPSVVAASADVALWAGLPRRAIERAEVAIANSDAADDVIEPIRTRAWASVELGIRVARPARGDSLSFRDTAQRGAAAELRALAASRRGAAVDAARAFDQAARLWAPVDAPSALVCRWAADDARRQVGDVEAAVGGLRATLDAALAMGFEPLAARVRRSLRLAGERPTAPWIPRPSGGSLTGRERQVLDLVERGRTNAEIARRMGLGRPTVARLLSNAMDKLGAESRAHAVVLAATA